MDEKEKKELIGKILNVDNDPRMARVATTVFINKATEEEAHYFLQHLEHSNPAVKKIARSILGQLAIEEAVPKLIEEFYAVVGALTFLPDAEYKEAFYYGNLIEILEAIFAIVKIKGLKDEDFFTRVDDIFMRTKNEDLKFTLIKLVGLLGDRFDYFMKYFDDFSEKEKRALYYVYSFVKDPRSMEIYKKGMESDAKNMEYILTNMLTFDEGKKFLSNELLSMSNYNKQAVLKKLQEGKYPEFNEVLIKLLSDKNKFLVELSIEVLKNNVTSDFSLDPFIKLVETGYSPEGIAGALEIIDHFVKKNPEDIYLQGLEKQPSHKNKNIILEFLLEKLKTKLKNNEGFTDKVLPKLLVYFDVYTKEKEELFISIFKIITTLQFPNSGKLKALKQKIIGFAKEFDKRLSSTFRNNLSEFLVKLNHMVGRFEESEAKVKQVAVLFDIDHSRIDHARMMKLKEQLADITLLGAENEKKLVALLIDLSSRKEIDWKVKTVALDLLGEYGGVMEMPPLMDIVETESSLAVKTNAQKALAKIEERCADEIQPVLIMEPLFYIQKMLNEFFKSKAFKVINLNETVKFSEPEISEQNFKFIVVSENLMQPEFAQMIFDYMDTHMEAIMIIVTAKPETHDVYKDLPNVRFLKKPFKNDSLNKVIS